MTLSNYRYTLKINIVAWYCNFLKGLLILKTYVLYLTHINFIAIIRPTLIMLLILYYLFSFDMVHFGHANALRQV